MFGVLTSAIGFALMVALAVSAGPPDKPPTDARMLIALLGLFLLWLGFAVVLRGSKIIRWGGSLVLAVFTAVFPAAVVQYTASTSEPRAGLTYANYRRLQEGMTYPEVVKVLGSNGTEMSRVDLAGSTTVMYSWQKWSGANMNATFQNGRLISKAQFGLD